MRIYNPTCPHCGSENTHALVASAADKTKAVAAAAAIAVTSLPIIKVDILCEDCGRFRGKHWGKPLSPAYSGTPRLTRAR